MILLSTSARRTTWRRGRSYERRHGPARVVAHASLRFPVVSRCGVLSVIRLLTGPLVNARRASFTTRTTTTGCFPTIAWLPCAQPSTCTIHARTMPMMKIISMPRPPSHFCSVCACPKQTMIWNRPRWIAYDEELQRHTLNWCTISNRRCRGYGKTTSTVIVQTDTERAVN